MEEDGLSLWSGWLNIASGEWILSEGKKGGGSGRSSLLRIFGGQNYGGNVICLLFFTLKFYII